MNLDLDLEPDWATSSGIGVRGTIVVLTALMAVGIGLGASIGGGDIVTPIVGSAVLGIYAAALAGIGFAFGGLVRSSLAGEVVAGVVILTFMIDLIAPAIKAPDWVHELALTAHLGQPMVGVWDVPGIVLCAVLAVGGLLLGAWGFQRRDVRE